MSDHGETPTWVEVEVCVCVRMCWSCTFQFELVLELLVNLVFVELRVGRLKVKVFLKGHGTIPAHVDFASAAVSSSAATTWGLSTSWQKNWQNTLRTFVRQWNMGHGSVDLALYESTMYWNMHLKKVPHTRLGAFLLALNDTNIKHVNHQDAFSAENKWLNHGLFTCRANKKKICWCLSAC